jgi:hypothetical protein
MNRRHFLAGAVSLTGVLILSGCGGGGGDDGGVRTITTRGTVALPSGGATTGLRVANGYGSAALTATSGFTLTVAAEVPGITLVLDGAGKLTLLGFVDPSAVSNTLDATSAAVALLYLALGGAQGSLNDKGKILDALQAQPAVGPLATTIAARLTADPLALHNADAQIQAALVAARDAIRAANRSVSVPGIKPVTRAEGLPPRMIIQPTGQQSGVELLQDPARDGAMLPVNYQRRWCKVFAYRVGFEDTTGNRQNLATAEALNNGDALNATAPVGGVFTTLAQLFTGSVAWGPMNGISLPLTMKDGDVKTFVETVVVGSAFTQSEPEFFSAPRYAAQVALWREARQRLNLISWMADIFFGLFLEVLGVRSAVVDLAAYEAAAAAWEQIDNIALRNIIAQAKSGQMPRALAELVKLGLTEGEGLVLFRELAAKSARLIAMVAGEKAVLSETLWAAGFKALSNLVLAAPGIVMGAVDLGAVVKDLSDANAADLWTATLIKPTVVISPSTTQLGVGQELNLTATVPGAASGATFSYQWTLTGSNLASLRGEGKTGSSIETSSATAALTTTPSTQGTLTVTVKAFQRGNGGTKTLVGEAKATITMTDASTTRTVFLEEWDTGTFPTPAGNYLVLAGFLVFPLSSTPVKEYRITVNSPSGRYGGPDLYRIRSSDIGPSGPETTPVANQIEIDRRHETGVNESYKFFRRGNNLYMFYESGGFYEGYFLYGNTRAEMQAQFRAWGESFTVLFETVP